MAQQEDTSYECASDGSFEPLQCRPEASDLLRCFCVNPDSGAMIPNTETVVTTRDDAPDCASLGENILCTDLCLRVLLICYQSLMQLVALSYVLDRPSMFPTMTSLSMLMSVKDVSVTMERPRCVSVQSAPLFKGLLQLATMKDKATHMGKHFR